MSVAHLTETVRETIHHLTMAIEGKIRQPKLDNILSDAICIAETLGKPYNTDPTFYTSQFTKSIKSFFEDLRDDKIRVVPEDDQFDQHRLVFDTDNDWITASSLKSDKNRPFFPISTKSAIFNPFLPPNRPQKTDELNHPRLQNRRNGRLQRNRRGPTDRSRNWAARMPDRVPGPSRDVHTDYHRNDPLPPPSPHLLPPPTFSLADPHTVPIGQIQLPAIHTFTFNLSAEQLPRYPFTDQDPNQLTNSQQVQYIAALQRECKKMHALARM